MTYLGVGSDALMSVGKRASCLMSLNLAGGEVKVACLDDEGRLDGHGLLADGGIGTDLKSNLKA